MNKKIKSRIESLLFVSGKPIPFRKLLLLLKMKDKKELRSVLEEINSDYEKREGGLRLMLKSDSAQLVTSPDNAGFVQKLVTDELQEELSKAALETLSIIAYRGPISRPDIEMIRGVNCIYILRSLMMRGLINKTKSKKDSRMHVYEVSFELMKHLGVSNVNELPKYEEMHKKIKFEQDKNDKSGKGDDKQQKEMGLEDSDRGDEKSVTTETQKKTEAQT